MSPKATVVKTQSAPIINSSTKIRSLIDAHLIYNGQESGQRYEWNRAGAIVEVDEKDVPELLAKRLGGRTCCGSDREGNKIFEIVGE